MKQYIDTLKFVLENGTERKDRTGVGTIGVFGLQSRYNLQDGFPALTTKKLYFKGVVHELLWFLKGDTNIKYLVDNDVNIWNDNAYDYYLKVISKENNIIPYSKEDFIDNIKNFGALKSNKYYTLGDLGPVYGKQWRSWNGYDQINDIIRSIKENPYSRRHIVSAWNIADVDSMALPPCHVLFQFYVSNDNRLSCQLYQRSCDLFLGAGFNIASYSILTHMIAQLCGLSVGDFIHTIGDGHIYLSHINQVREQLGRTTHDLPKLWLNPEIKNIDDFKYEDIKLIGYKSHPAIKGVMAV